MWWDKFKPSNLPATAQTWVQILKSLPYDGGPSVTRWVFLRTAEVVALGFVVMVGGGVYRYVRFGTADAIFWAAVGGLGGAMFGFAKSAQVTKLSIDAKTPGSGSTVESGLTGSTVTEVAASGKTAEAKDDNGS